VADVAAELSCDLACRPSIHLTQVPHLEAEDRCRLTSDKRRCLLGPTSGSPPLQVAQKTGAPRKSASVNLNDPVIRFLSWVVAIAVAIRITFELICPVMPYLAAFALIVVIVRLVSWYRGRW
jgi:hypothetical protein